MNVLILGYGKEGKAAKAYFESRGDKITVLDSITPEDLGSKDLSSCDLILRSPSFPPQTGVSSSTRYFFDHCPAPIIGVTGTKGKGTTCSLIASILEALGRKVFLLGNIGIPALSELDKITKDDVVVFELSSFQLWDLEKSPHVAVVLRIEPDHLDVHKDFADYVAAKSHIVRAQTPGDAVIYFRDNPDSTAIAELSPGRKFPYPLPASDQLSLLLDSLSIPGDHNRENAEVALLAVAAFLNLSLEELMDRYFDDLKNGLSAFRGLPHHIEFVRNVHGVDYYDDSFSASEPSLEVAIKTFRPRPVILIAGGKDRGLDLTPAKRAIFDAPNLKKAILSGETAPKLAAGEDPKRYLFAGTLKEAVTAAKKLAEEIKSSTLEASTIDTPTPEATKISDTPNSSSDAPMSPVVLLSPGAPSFDMFKDFYDRGDQFQALVKDLK